MPPPPDKNFHAPESSSFRKLVEHVIDEMGGHVIVAFGLVGFMFFYGMAMSVAQLSGRDLAQLDYPLGLICGSVGSVTLTVWLLLVKYRKK